MGLIKALTTSTSSAIGDQFKEYVSCPTMESGVLVQRGEVHHGSGNKNPSEGIITNGSAIMVPEGTAMMVVEMVRFLTFLLRQVLILLIVVLSLVYLLVDLVKVLLILLRRLAVVLLLEEAPLTTREYTMLIYLH